MFKYDNVILVIITIMYINIYIYYTILYYTDAWQLHTSGHLSIYWWVMSVSACATNS